MTIPVDTMLARPKLPRGPARPSFPNNLEALRIERRPCSKSWLAMKARLTRDRYLRIALGIPGRFGGPTLPTREERERILVAINLAGAARKLPPVTIEDLGLEVDPGARSVGRPKLSDEKAISA